MRSLGRRRADFDLAAHVGGMEVAAECVVAGHLGHERQLAGFAGLEGFRIRDSVVLRLVFAVEASYAQIVLLAIVVCDTNRDRFIKNDAPAVGAELQFTDANRNDPVLGLGGGGVEFLSGVRLALELRCGSRSSIL